MFDHCSHFIPMCCLTFMNSKFYKDSKVITKQLLIFLISMKTDILGLIYIYIYIYIFIYIYIYIYIYICVCVYCYWTYLLYFYAFLCKHTTLHVIVFDNHMYIKIYKNP